MTSLGSGIKWRDGSPAILIDTRLLRYYLSRAFPILTFAEQAHDEVARAANPQTVFSINSSGR